METQPDLTFYFAIHDAQRAAVRRYRDAVADLVETDRRQRGAALARWAKGFTLELEEHHYVEDEFFFPSLRTKVPTARSVLDDLDAQHRHLDQLLAQWPSTLRQLADPAVPFAAAQRDAIAFASELHDFIHCHLAIEDQDVLPLFWRNYTAAEYDVVFQQAVKKGKKAGLWFVAPFTVDCYPEGPERDAFLASVPGILRLIHRLVRPRYDRLVRTAFGDETVDVPTAP